MCVWPSRNFHTELFIGFDLVYIEIVYYNNRNIFREPTERFFNMFFSHSRSRNEYTSQLSHNVVNSSHIMTDLYSVRAECIWNREQTLIKSRTHTFLRLDYVANPTKRKTESHGFFLGVSLSDARIFRLNIQFYQSMMSFSSYLLDSGYPNAHEPISIKTIT